MQHENTFIKRKILILCTILNGAQNGKVRICLYNSFGDLVILKLLKLKTELKLNMFKQI